MDNENGDELWRRRLRSVVSDHGGPSAVSRLSEIPLQTLKNHLNGRTKKAPIEGLRRIAATCSVSFAWLMGGDEKNGTKKGDTGPSGTPETELSRFKHALPNRKQHDYWRVTTSALDLDHIVPGDLIEFRDDKKARKGDVVMAEVSDGGGAPRLVLRVYVPPYLMTHSFDAANYRQPLEVDGKTVRIVGVFSQLLRIG